MRKAAFLFSFIILLFSLTGCPNNLFSPDNLNHQDYGSPPEGKGYFSLQIAGVSSRTIMPTPSIAAYKLEFFLASTPTVAAATAIRTDDDVSAPVVLSPGTYNLTVTAYADAHLASPAATATLSGANAIQIVAGGTITGSVTLIAHGFSAGSGTFSWNVQFPDDLDEASMRIQPVSAGGTADQTLYFVSETETPLTSVTSACSLNSGYYYITLTLKKDERTITWIDTLHIYQNMTSHFSPVFTAAHFNTVSYLVILKYNDEGATPDNAATYQDGEAAVLDTPVRGGYYFGGWYTDNGTFINEWTSGTPVTANTILYAKWTAAAVVVKVGGEITGSFEDLADALSSISSAGIYTVEVRADQTLEANWTVPAGADVTITSSGAAKTITRGALDTDSDNGLFIVGGTGAQLTLGNIIVDGDKDNTAFSGNAASLVRVNTGGTLTMNAGAVLQNNRAIISPATNNGGGVYLNGGTFNLNGGYISGNTGSGVLMSSGTFNIADGGINNNSNSGVYVNGGTFNMEGGTISENTAGGGGGVWIGDGIFNMSAGTISGNTATSTTSGGGGVSVVGGTFNMSGGTISGNTVDGSLLNLLGLSGGGGVFINSGTFNMEGGEIKENIAATRGSGVGVMGTGTFRLGGTAKIRGNTLTDTTASNVCLADDIYITLGDGTGTPAVPVPANGMEVWVQTMTADGVIVESGASAGIVNYFHADEANKIVTLSGSQLKIVDAASQGFSITIPDFIDDVPIVSDIKLSLSGTAPNPSTETLEVTNSYPSGTVIEWFSSLSPGYLQTGESKTLVLDVSDAANPYSFVGTHYIYVEVRLPSGGAVYGANIEFEVVP